MRRPSVSELAALGWIVGGLVATVAVQRATDGEHSVTAGLRAHPIAAGVLGALFVAHVYQWPPAFTPYDPFAGLKWLVDAPNPGTVGAATGPSTT